ncbi:MAG: hypothetical protein ACLP5H_09640 [Desulfomonilaceae bacterium]
MPRMQKQLSTQSEANEEFEGQEVRPLAEELHGVTEESLRENFPESTFRKFFTPAEVLEPEENDLQYEEDEEDGNGKVTEAEAQLMSEEAVKAVVHKINEIAIRTVESGVMEIGEYVLSEVFHDKLEDVLSHSPYKSASLTQICADPELMVNRRRLGTYVKAAALKQELQAKDVDCSNLMFSQLAALLKMSDVEKRLELATEANQDGLSARAILDRIEATKKRKLANKTEELFKKLADPLGVLGDEDIKELLSNPQRLKEELKSEDRWDMVKVIDKAATQMEESTNLFKEARVHLVRIELGDPKPEAA